MVMVTVRELLFFLMAILTELLTPLLMSLHFSQQAWHELPMAKLQVTLASVLPGTTATLWTSVVSVRKEPLMGLLSSTLIHTLPTHISLHGQLQAVHQ